MHVFRRCVPGQTVRRIYTLVLKTAAGLLSERLCSYMHSVGRSVAGKSDEMCAHCRRTQTNCSRRRGGSISVNYLLRDRDVSRVVCRINMRRRAPEGAGPEAQLATPTSGGLGTRGAGPGGACHLQRRQAAWLSQRNCATYRQSMSRWNCWIAIGYCKSVTAEVFLQDA